MESLIIQWNCAGARRKKEDLLQLIDEQKPAIICLQETLLQPYQTFKIPNYNIIRKDGPTLGKARGGTAICIHSSIPIAEVTVNSDLQPTAVEVNIQTPFTICNIYISPRSESLNPTNLNNLINQLKPPYILLGDFNAHSPLWGCCTNTDRGGKVIEQFLLEKNLNILNTGIATRQGYNNSETAIDLTICSPQIQPLLKWDVYPTPRASDHFPILISILGSEKRDIPTFRNFKKADWLLYENHQTWNEIPQEFPKENLRRTVDDLYERLNKAAEDSIPRSTHHKFFPKPWWNAALKKSHKLREAAYKKFRQNKSPLNEYKWKKLRAEHAYSIKIYKEEEYKKTCSSLTSRTPSSMIWNTINKIRGKRPPRSINMLIENDQTFKDTEEICNKLAYTFASTSSTRNYSNSFQNIKQQEEANPLNFNVRNEEIYNKPITMSEMLSALSQCRNTSPGPDEISYDMIRKLPPIAKNHILEIFNCIFENGEFPDQWRESVIIPVPKPGKKHSDPKNYRPIALTSTLCKTMERILNTRLLDWLERQHNFGYFQSGGLKNKSTLDHLSRLEGAVRKSFLRKDQMISVFFDLEKAYDLTWRYGILRDLYKRGLRGNLAIFIQNFLQNRTFRVRLDNCLSGKHVQENGIPQGSVLSVTLFIVKVDEITKLIPRNENFLVSLYMDDLQISYTHCDIGKIGGELQK